MSTRGECYFGAHFWRILSGYALYVIDVPYGMRSIRSTVVHVKRSLFFGDAPFFEHRSVMRRLRLSDANAGEISNQITFGCSKFLVVGYAGEFRSRYSSTKRILSLSVDTVRIVRNSPGSRLRMTFVFFFALLAPFRFLSSERIPQISMLVVPEPR